MVREVLAVPRVPAPPCDGELLLRNGVGALDDVLVLVEALNGRTLFLLAGAGVVPRHALVLAFYDHRILQAVGSSLKCK